MKLVSSYCLGIDFCVKKINDSFLLGLNDPPTSLSSQSKPKMSELSNQWTSLQVCTDSSVVLLIVMLASRSSFVHVFYAGSSY